jgi:hypothetical protein
MPLRKPQCKGSRRHSARACAPGSGPTSKTRLYFVLISLTSGSHQNISSATDRLICRKEFGFMQQALPFYDTLRRRLFGEFGVAGFSIVQSTRQVSPDLFLRQDPIILASTFFMRRISCMRASSSAIFFVRCGATSAHDPRGGIRKERSLLISFRVNPTALVERINRKQAKASSSKSR